MRQSQRRVQAVDATSGDDRLTQKSERLAQILRELDSVLVAFSGGVDSTYLAYAAKQALEGPNRLLAVTGESPSYPQHQRELATKFVTDFGIPHLFVETREMASDAYRANGADRCFHCKNELYSLLTTVAEQRGLRFIVDGANADDRIDFRPGRKAAKERGVRSPLEEAGLTKEEIRRLSRQASLPTADEPASACLSSRIPYRSPITAEKLRTVENGENVLRVLGFRQFRVRHHGNLVRLEFGAPEIGRAVTPEMMLRLVEAFKKLGFTYVTVDLQGYRTGSLNESLSALPELPVV